MSTTSFKVRVRELTQIKQDWLSVRVSEYARIYNEASKYLPSLGKERLDIVLKSANPNAFGIWVMDINPMFTSQTCSHCGAMGIRDGIGFKCTRCGLGIGSNPISTIGQYNADVNASINITLKGLFALYGQKKRSVADLNEQPDGNIVNPIPTEMIDMNGKDDRKIGELPNETNVSRNSSSQDCVKQVVTFVETQCLNAQAMVGHQVDCVPENGLSYPYKGFDKYPVRTKSDEKIAIGEVLSKSKFC